MFRLVSENLSGSPIGFEERTSTNFCKFFHKESEAKACAEQDLADRGSVKTIRWIQKHGSILSQDLQSVLYHIREINFGNKD